MVQAIDVGSTPEGYHFFVMEYIEGPTLYDMMQPPPVGDSHQFTEAEALDITVQVCEALVHAHQRGLIHRDVKPKNIILTPQGTAKLTDLGLARAQDDTSAAQLEAGKAYGTPYYISPEQIRGDVDIDFRADINSLGATLYHMLTGRPPFEAGDSQRGDAQASERRPAPARPFGNHTQCGGGEVIEVAMAKKREERYATTLEMLEDLVAVRAGQAPMHARRTVDLEQLASIDPGKR